MKKKVSKKYCRTQKDPHVKIQMQIGNLGLAIESVNRLFPNRVSTIEKKNLLPENYDVYFFQMQLAFFV